MCISTNDFSYDSPKTMGGLKLAFLPPPPCKEKRVSSEACDAIMNNLDALCCPFDVADHQKTSTVKSTSKPTSTLQLSIQSQSNPMVIRALMTMEDRAQSPSPESDDCAASAPTRRNVTDPKISERLSRLMLSADSNHGSRKRSNSSKSLNSEDGIPCLGRRVARTPSGNALCA